MQRDQVGVCLRARKDIGQFGYNLKVTLEEHGFSVITRGLPTSRPMSNVPDGFVTLDLSLPTTAYQARQWDRVVRGGPRMLVVLEPPVSAPILTQTWFLKRFSLIFAASPFWSSRYSGVCIPWPYSPPPGQGRVELPPGPSGPTAVDGPARVKATMVLASKRSAVLGEQYSLRRQVLREMDRAGVPVAVIGQHWDSPTRSKAAHGAAAAAKALLSGERPRMKSAFSDLRFRPPNYLGVMRSKGDALKVAPVTLIVENSDDYVSEKLIDAIVLGAVPLVVGRNPSDLGVPAGVFLHAHTPEAAAQFLAKSPLHDKDLDLIRANGRLWCDSLEGPLAWERIACELICRHLASALWSQ